MSGEITAEFRHHVSAEYSFPFPPAHELARLNEVVPGGAERVMTLVEEEAKHRRTLEKKQLEAQIADLAAERTERWWGQVFGFGIGIVAIVGGVVAAGLGHPATGSIIGGTGVAGLVSVFVLGRVLSEKQGTSPSEAQSPSGRAGDEGPQS